MKSNNVQMSTAAAASLSNNCMRMHLSVNKASLRKNKLPSTFCLKHVGGANKLYLVLDTLITLALIVESNKNWIIIK